MIIACLFTLQTLQSYSNLQVKPFGTANLIVTHKDIQNEVQENILSGDVAEKLDLLRIINSLNTAQEELVRDFPALIKTTGTSPGENSIKIDENAQGVPAAIKQMAIEKLREMEDFGYITPVNGLVQWSYLAKKTKSESVLTRKTSIKLSNVNITP